MLCKIAIGVLWSVLLLIYAFIANFIPRGIVKLMKKYAKNISSDNRGSGEYTLPLGTIEIFSFALSIVLGVVAFIGVWLGVRTLNRWKTKDRGEGPTEACAINIFLTGNLLSVLMGVLGGLFFKWLSNLWAIADILKISY